jgi:alkylation response protein AidB-like acyl-CoA dehydrogenase
VRDGVAVGPESDGFLVAASSSEGPSLAYVPRGATGLSIEPQATVDGRPLARLRLDDVAAGPAISGANDKGALQRGLYDRLLVAASAELVGGMGAALDMTVEYLKTRKQFGKPIGSFQALQHRAVDDYTRIISSRALLFQVAAQGGALTSAMASALKAHAGGV